MVKERNKDDTGSEESGKLPTMKSLKSSSTKSLNKARQLVTVVEGLLQKPYSAAIRITIGEHKRALEKKLKQLNNLPNELHHLMRKNPDLCSTKQTFACNRQELEDHLELREYQPLRERVVCLLADIDRWLMENNETELETRSTQSGDNRSGITHSEENNSAHGHSSSTLNSAELIENWGRQIEQVCRTQNLLIATVDSLQNSYRVDKEQQARWNNGIIDAMQKLQAQVNQLQENQRINHESAMNNKNVRFAESPEVQEKESERDSRNCLGQAIPTIPTSAIGIETPSLVKKEKTDQSGVDGKNQSTERVEKLTSPMMSPPESPSPLLASNLVTSITSSIEPFDGNPENYLIFIQTFDMLVHDNVEIPTNMKQTLLLRLLSGEAKEAMKSTKISEADYKLLRDNLERQYNRPNDTIQMYMDQLQQHTFSENNYDEMEKELNRFVIIANNLRVAGVHVDDALFTKGFISKLPQSIMGPIFRKHRSQQRKFDELVVLVYATIAEKKALEKARDERNQSKTVTEVMSLQANEAKRKGHRSGGKHNPGQGEERSENGYSSHKNRDLSTCFFCNERSHISRDCRLPAKNKKEITKMKGRCTRCLSKLHSADDCESDRKCYWCNCNHHSWHCPNINQNENVENTEKGYKKQSFRIRETENSDSE